MWGIEVYDAGPAQPDWSNLAERWVVNPGSDQSAPESGIDAGAAPSAEFHVAGDAQELAEALAWLASLNAADCISALKLQTGNVSNPAEGPIENVDVNAESGMVRINIDWNSDGKWTKPVI